MSLPAGTHIGKYVVQRKLAEGGMAEIFLASSFGPEGFEKQVIIKRIRPTFADDASFVEMFVSEARLVSKLNHANIVQIFDFDRHEDTFYIAMEYVRGKSLAQAHQRARELSIPLSPVLAAQITVEVARGLSFAHRLTERGQLLNLVHRDVTPQNVLLSYEGAVKLTDFGIAKAGSRASTVGMLKGKFAYMSPEQSRGEPVDCRTDIFALGITLWELLSGGRLFDGDSDIAVLRAVQERRVLSPQQLNPSVDEALSNIVMRCLERDRSARYQTAQELERALNRYVITTAERAEDTEVGAWMRELFPIESARTENTVFQPVPAPARPEGAASPGMAAAAQPFSGSTAMPPDMLYGSTSRSEGRPAVSQGAARRVSAFTPVVPPEEMVPGQATSRTPRATWLSKPMLVVGGAAIGSTLVAVVLAVVLGTKKPDPVPTPAPVPAAPARPTELSLAPPAEVKPAPVAPPPTPAPVAPVVVPAPVAPAPPKHSASTPKQHRSTSSAKAGPTVAGPPGKLVLTITPWGEVIIDGKRRASEQVGKAEYELPPGSHSVQVKGGVAWGPKQVTIQSGQSTLQTITK